jgi:hypothetical protein
MNKKLKKMPIIFIVIIAMAVNIALIYSALNSRNSDSQHGDTADAASDDTTVDVYCVTYYGASGEILQTSDVEKGKYAIPPNMPDVGADTVFLGWDKNFPNVFDDLDIYPILKDVSDTKNVISISAHHIASGEQLRAQIKLGGWVECSYYELEILYDPSSLLYIGAEAELPSVSITADIGLVKMILDAREDITEGAELVTLVFEAINEQFTYTELRLDPGLIQQYDSGGDRINTDSTLYNGKIYIYKKT